MQDLLFEGSTDQTVITMVQTEHNKKYFPRLLQFVVVITLILIVSGCGDSNVSDLRDYVQDIKAKKVGSIPPLPEVKKYETYAYKDDDLRDPFQATIARKVAKSTNNPYQPNLKRQREVLEQFPLDTLKMVGSLEQNGQRWALIKGEDGTLYRTKRGNYMGQDHGKIVRITETEVVLQETVPDGLGGWVRRQATLSVTE